MAGIMWVVAIPLVIVGAALLWILSRRIPAWGLILCGMAIHVLGRLLAHTYPIVADGNTGERFGSFFTRSMPDVAFVLQILGTVAVIHGILMWTKKG